MGIGDIAIHSASVTACPEKVICPWCGKTVELVKLVAPPVHETTGRANEWQCQGCGKVFYFKAPSESTKN